MMSDKTLPKGGETNKIPPLGGLGGPESSKGWLSLVGIGPGDLRQLTAAAQAVLTQAEVIIGYQFYLDLLAPLLTPAQEVIVSPLGSEMARAGQAVDLAEAGRRVALVSSGDIGIYAMASPVFEVLRARGWQGEPGVEVLPGISAVQAVAARLGAPLGHDFCTISLSDLLTPWPVIERRVQAAAWGDFVIAFYNPRSQKRDWQLRRALDILRAHRAAETSVAIVRNVTRPDETVHLTTLANLDPAQVDMFTLVLIGNSQSYTFANHLITPRGYTDKNKDHPNNQGSPNLQSPIPNLQSPNLQSPNRPISNPPTSQPPNLYPITLTHLSTTQAIVIGGGPVGQRKVAKLLDAGARVRLISPVATAQLQAWAEAGQIEWLKRVYQPGDLEGARLVFAATNQRQVNAAIAEEAAARRQLCNVADAPDEGDFHVPAVHRRVDGIMVAVSTSGQSPTRARRIRDDLAAWLNEKF